MSSELWAVVAQRHNKRTGRRLADVTVHRCETWEEADRVAAARNYTSVRPSRLEHFVVVRLR